jgi:nucleotide-binding universal stress UspA family protein
VADQVRGDGGGDGPRVVLAAVDGSITSNRAISWAAGLARRQKSRLLCLYVARHSAFASLALATSATGIPVNYDTDEVAKEIFEDLRANARRHDMELEFLVRSGDPAREIEKVADEVHADLVVVGASLKAGHRLVGSVAVRLVRAAKWPVTVVP